MLESCTDNLQLRVLIGLKFCSLNIDQFYLYSYMTRNLF